MRSDSQSGFIIGVILAVVVLIALIAAMISKTTTSMNMAPSVIKGDIALMRSYGAMLSRAVQRIESSANTCPAIAGASRRNCFADINNGLRLPASLAPPCEKDTNPEMTIRRCPFHSVYGGASRMQMSPSLFTSNTGQPWRVAYKDIGSPPDKKTQIILFIGDIKQDVCLLIEKEETGKTSATIQPAAGLNPLDPSDSRNAFPSNRSEGCFRTTGSFISPPTYQYFSIVSSIIP